MQWWIWPLSGFCVWLAVAIAGRYLISRRVSSLTLMVIPSWYVLHQTMGYAFGRSYWFWLLLAWLIVGMCLAAYLLSTACRWRWQTFWRCYWRWTGLYAVLAIVIVSGIACFV